MKTGVDPLVFGESELVRRWGEFRAGVAPHPKVRVIDEYGNAARFVFRLDDAKLVSILEVEHHDDGRYWAHLSVSCHAPKRLPTWKELRWAKEHFLGDRRAIQVLPPRSEYVNITFNVLNLYACLDGEVLPDFRMLDRFTGDIGI